METKVILFYIAIFILSFLLVGPVIMNSIGKFGVQKKFSKEMVEKGIITEEIYKKVQRMQEILAVIFFVSVIAIISYAGMLKSPYSWIVIVIGTGLGCFLSRKSVQYSVVTFHTFKAAYQNYFDIDKYNEIAMKFI